MTDWRQIAGAALLVVIGSALLWWIWHATPTARPPMAAPTAVHNAASEAAEATPTAVVGTPPGYRLAGVAVGNPSFAVVEQPNGHSALYTVDADIPGLGRLRRIESEHIVVLGEGGEVALWLGPAATATITPLRAATRRPAALATPGHPAARTTPAVTATPQPLERRAGTADGSTP